MLRHPHLALGREGIVILTAYYILVYYTLSDLGDLSNLIGSLFRTIQQYSPPSEWIMCELSRTKSTVF